MGSTSPIFSYGVSDSYLRNIFNSALTIFTAMLGLACYVHNTQLGVDAEA